jgi:hypothetical protein
LAADADARKAVLSANHGRDLLPILFEDATKELPLGPREGHSHKKKGKKKKKKERQAYAVNRENPGPACVRAPSEEGWEVRETLHPSDPLSLQRGSVLSAMSTVWSPEKFLC